jgi:V8-like Glu-specific endopeptidase
VAVACVAVALCSTAPSAWAASGGSGATAPASAVASIRIDADAAQQALDYWTPERRAAALDATTTASGSESDSVSSSAAAAIPRAEQVSPVPHIGTIFYTQNGAGYGCSANVVQSANRSTLATAGHCLTQKHGWSTNIVFYPAYESGESAYGAWPVIYGQTTPDWYEKNNDAQEDDTAFLAVGLNDDGDDITSVVGASPVLFDQSATRASTAYGYPASLRFDGEHLERCRGVGEAYSAEQIALRCDMNEGVSGGPVFAGDDANGPQFANVAERYEDYSHVLGPIWQATEKSVYDRVAAFRE